jgi:hypothetical protein
LACTGDTEGIPTYVAIKVSHCNPRGVSEADPAGQGTVFDVSGSAAYAAGGKYHGSSLRFAVADG